MLRMWRVLGITALPLVAATGIDPSLEECLRASVGAGSLFVQGREGYNAAKQCVNRRSDSEPWPLAVVQPRGVTEVQAVVRCASKYRVQLCAKGGGRGYENAAGCTGGVAVDMRSFQDVGVDTDGQVVRFGAGTCHGQVYHTLDQEGLVVPLGDSSGVGAVGLALACGRGRLAQMLGSACESILQVEYVDASGEFHTAGDAMFLHAMEERAVFLGCHVNSGEKRISGHMKHMSVGSCALLASQEGHGYFGLEYPQGSTIPGQAECLTFATVPTLMRTANVGECEGEGLFKGKWLGSHERLALYQLTTVKASPRSAPVEYTGCYSVESVDAATRSDNGTTLDACKEQAQTGSKPFFGMLDPGRFNEEGQAACLILSALPSGTKAMGTVCRVEVFGGFPLGGPAHLAVYRVQADEKDPGPATTTTALPPPKPSPFTVPGIRYEGCFRNEEVESINVHQMGITLPECRNLARGGGKRHFGMEWPQGFATVGQAECWTLPELPETPRVDDQVCEAERVGGYRLGSERYMAVYSLTEDAEPEEAEVPTGQLHSSTEALVRYEGCFVASKEWQHGEKKSVRDCKEQAEKDFKPFFALEGPEDFKEDGYARCNTLAAFPATQRVDDSECRGEVFKEYAMGSAERLAIYSLALYAAPEIAYRGCFVDADASRLLGRRRPATVARCALLAQQAKVASFGMEWPQGVDKEGQAECILYQDEPAMQRAPDSDCEGEVYAGHRLGSDFRVALYAIGGSAVKEHLQRRLGVANPAGDMGKQEEEDMLWMVRGAGGEFPGIVTRIYMKAYPAVGKVTTWSCKLTPGAAKEVIKRWVAFGEEVTPKRKLSTQLLMFGRPAAVEVRMHCLGCQRDEQSWAAAKLDALMGSSEHSCTLPQSRSWTEAVMEQSSWEYSMFANAPAKPVDLQTCVDSWSEGKAAVKVGAHLGYDWAVTDELVNDLLYWVHQNTPAREHGVMVQWDLLTSPRALGSRLSPMASNAKWVLQYKHMWETSESHFLYGTMMDHHKKLSSALDKHLPCTGSYNYLDKDLPCAERHGSWLEAYFSNASRMKSIKAKADPNNIFRSNLAPVIDAHDEGSADPGVPGANGSVAWESQTTTPAPTDDLGRTGAGSTAGFKTDRSLGGFTGIKDTACFWDYGSTGVAGMSPKYGVASVQDCREECLANLECEGFVMAQDTGDHRCWLGRDMRLVQCQKDAPYTTWIADPKMVEAFKEHKSSGCFAGAGADAVPGKHPMSGVLTVSACREACLREADCEAFVKMPDQDHPYCWLVKNLDFNRCEEGVPYSTFVRLSVVEGKWLLGGAAAALARNVPTLRIQFPSFFAALFLLPAAAATAALACTRAELFRRGTCRTVFPQEYTSAATLDVDDVFNGLVTELN